MTAQSIDYPGWSCLVDLMDWHHVPLARCVQLRVAHAPRTCSPPPRVSDPDMHHGTCVTHVWCMTESVTSSFLWRRRRGKRSHHSRRKRNLRFYVFGKRPMSCAYWWNPVRAHSHHPIIWFPLSKVLCFLSMIWIILWIWTKFHGIPWNHICCWNVVQKVPWNSGESSMELFDQRVSISIEKRFWMRFCYVMSNVGNAYKV